MAYPFIPWNTGDPITQERMNKIEQGITDAHNLAANSVQKATTDALDTRIDALEGSVGNNQTGMTLTDKIANLETLVGQASGEDSPGAKAYVQVLGATTNNSPQYDSLDARFENVEREFNKDRAGALANDVSLLSQEVAATHVRQNTDGTNTNFTNLVQRLNNSDQNYQNLNAAYTSFINVDYANAKGIYDTLGARLAADEQKYNGTSSQVEAACKPNGSLDDRFDDIEKAIDAAKASSAKNQTYDSMDARFEAIENEIVGARGGQTNIDARLDNIEGDISGVSSGKIDKTSIANNLTTTAGGYVLDARQGKILNDAKVNYIDVKNDLTSTDIDKPLSAKQGKVLDEKITALAGTVNSKDSAMDERVDALEANVNGAKVADGPQTLDARFDAVEGRATTLETQVQNIANELSMTDISGEIKDTTSRIDTLETNVVAMANEIGMLQNGAEVQDMASAITGNSSRIDTLESRMTAVDGENGTVAGLATRIGTAESNITTLSNDLNAENTGLKARMTSAEGRLTNVETTANAAATKEALGALTGRVKTLEDNPKSATVVIDNVTYDNDGKPSDIGTQPSPDVDYLLKKGDKYYYWKYLNDKWQLISGAGGGNGTSSGTFVDSLEDINTPDKNTDYFVGTNSTGYLHYRYIQTPNSDTLKPVIIGLHDYYQIDTREETEDNDTVTYLDLYKFNSARTQETLTEQDYEYIIGSVKLPKGGSMDASTERIYVKIPAGQNQYMSYADLQANGLNLNFSYTCYSIINGDYNYTAAKYELKLEDGTIIKESNNIVPYVTREDYNAGVTNIQFTKSDKLAQYCNKNESTQFILTLSVPDREDIMPRTLTVTVTPVELTLSSTFSDQNTYSNTEDLTIPYIFTGIIDNDVSFEILFGTDNAETNITAACVINSAASRITVRRTNFTNKTGVYNLRIRAGQVVNGSMLYSNSLTYQLGLIQSDSTDILLFSGASLEEQVIEQYRTLTLPYYLYLPSNIDTAVVTYDVKQIIYNEQHEILREDSIPALIRPADSLHTGAQSYSLRISTMLEEVEYYKVIITCENAILTFNIKVNMAAEQINIETKGLLFDFKPEQFSNNALTLEEKLWHYENNGIKYSMRIPENAHFDWRTGGWIEDENHIPCFCVKAGSRVEFIQQDIKQNSTSPLTLFWTGMESTGSDFKCVFKIDNVKTPDAPFLTSLDTVKNIVTNYGKLILSSKQDIEDDETLLYKYLNTRYLYTQTINNKNKVVKESIGTTVLNDGVNEVYGRFGSQLTEAKRAAAETKAAKKNSDKIKDYINNIYTIANYARKLEHKEALLNILSGNEIGTTIDYSTIKDNILSYLQNVTNATSVYNMLTTLENDASSIIYAYRQEEPENLDAILNGFIVEGKEGKDGIIAMLEFTFKTTIENGGTFTSQSVSSAPISTNSFMGTATFLVTVMDKKYEVTMTIEDSQYTEIVSIQDASNQTETAYGLELNALGSNIYLPSGRVSYAHSEGDTIEFEYNINAPLDRKINSSIIIYEDGVPSAAKLYATGNNILEQTNPGNLIIGSDDCDVYIYKMRLYDHALTDKEILSNFYADGLTVEEMINRYNRNKNLITDDVDKLTPQLVAQECPDLRVIMIEAPNLTGGKTSFIKDSKIRCIYKNGRPEDNWVALNAYHAGQGTSSDNYGASARNLDIIFGFDGKDTVIVPKPQKNNYQFDPNYKSIIITGLNDDITNDIKTVEEYEAAGYSIHNNAIEDTPGTVSLSPTSVPNNWFNIKVNVASSENTNNAFLQKRFDRYLQEHVYKTPAQKRDSRIKNDMEFFNCVVFIKETGTPKEFTKDTGDERSWHFYGIGNIGDSKKTDKTRVNVPNDPYEFAVEISDNGLLLSGFYSGVFYISEASKLKSETACTEINGNMDIPEALSMTKSHICTSDEYSSNAGSYTFSISSPNNQTMYFIPEENGAYYRRFIYLNNAWTEVGEPISFKRTSYGVKYPVSMAEWECSLNEYHSALYNFGGKGWDKSFEFRYDITTKDGETVARSDLEEALNNLHQETNKTAFANMYSYIVTAPNGNFANQINDWFIDKSLPYWYLFTERYTMIDSRAKNTFYHYGKIYITEDEASGAKITELNTIKNSYLAEYINDNNIQAYKTATAEQIANAELDYQIATATFLHENAEYFEVDNEKAAINNGYRFEMWGYDMDTALGINNNGQMVFSAGMEDIDKDASGWIYNEAESVIWRRVRENMFTQLAALYINLKGDCFNAENLIEEFDRLQAQFPEELWRADFERKYYRPFRDLNETTYLNDMANGRKKYQRRQFERNMAIYINSKYQRNGSYIENDLISFRPQFTWTAGRDTRIIIKPYSTMYINFALGNYDNTDSSMSEVQEVFKRVQRGEEFIINAADYIHDYNNIQCILYNASRIMYLDGLGNFECKQFILGAAKKLSVLKLGSSVYTNHSMTDITNLGLDTGLPLLEELDLTNIEFGQMVDGTWISNPPQTFALENFPLLKRLNATGSNIRSFTFKDGGMLESIIFPSLLSKIEFNNLYNLVDTYDDENQVVPAVILTGAANLTSYTSINSYSNSYEIVRNMLDNAGINGITKLWLNDIDWTINNLSDLEPLAELQKKLGSNMYLAGKITVLGSWSVLLKTRYSTLWNNKITFNTDNGTETFQTEVIYIESGYDGINGYVDEHTITSKFINGGEKIPDLYTNSTPLDSLPKRQPTISRVFQFGTLYNEKYRVYTGWTLDQIKNEDTLTLYDQGYRDDEEKCLRANRDKNERLILYTYYTETNHQYTVRWCMHPENTNDPQIVKEESFQEYGKGYDIEAPTVKEIRKKYPTFTYEKQGDNITYKIFKGWEKLPTNISPTIEEANTGIYIIGPQWEEQTISINANDPNNLFSDTTNPNLYQLFALSNLSYTERNNYSLNQTIVAQQKYKYRMGYEGIKDTGYLLIDNVRDGEATIFNEDRSPMYAKYPGTDNYITPFSNNNGFTLVLDYQFDTTQAENGSAAVLVGCYANKRIDDSISTTGFALYNTYDSNLGARGIQVGFGNMFETHSGNYRSVGLPETRNIIVLRHPKNTNDLIIYSSKAGNSQFTLETAVTDVTISLGSLVLNSDAKLSFGHLIPELSNSTFIENNSQYQDESDIIRRAYGTIYWAKYWPEDLGAGECRQLAAWPHEEMTAIISDVNDTKTQNNRPSIYLTTLNGSKHMGLNLDSNSKFPVGSVGNTVIKGWHDSLIESLCNERVFSGLPIQLQSVINLTSLGYKNYKSEAKTDDFNAVTISTTLDTLRSTTNYIYLPSVSSLDLTQQSVYSDESIYERNGNTNIGANTNLTPFIWLQAAANLMEVYVRDGTKWTLSTARAEYLNLRFPYIPINFSASKKMRIFIINSQSEINNTTFKNLINDIQTGDIVCHYGGMAYMYVDGNTINRYGILPQSSSEASYLNTSGSGEWISSISYITRSVSSTQSYGNFIFINNHGTIRQPENSRTQPGLVNLNYSFAI